MKSLDFTTQWNTEINSISILNSKNQNATSFQPGDKVTTLLSITSNQPQSANITLSIQDASGNIINQTQIQTTLGNTTDQNQTTYTFAIPNNASTGPATINAAIYSGNYQNVNIPIAENRTAEFTIASNTTTTPTSTPSSTPTPTPNENSISLFSWLLVATGIFTFTVLFMFLRRKPIQIGPQMPNLPAIQITKTINASTFGSIEQASIIAPTATIASKKTVQETTTPIPIILESWKSQTTPSTEPIKQDTKSASSLKPSQTVAEHLSKITETGKNVQAIEATLKMEKDKLAKEIMELNKTLEDQENAMKNYFDSIRQAIAKIDPSINEKQTSTIQQNTIKQQDKKEEQK